MEGRFPFTPNPGKFGPTGIFENTFEGGPL